MTDFRGPTRVVGRPYPTVDAAAKVTGQTRFADDVVLPRMLHCKILRSSFAHARILRVDVSKAREMPGVAAVATDPSLAAEAFEQCRRIAVAEWFDRARPPIGDRLTDEQIELLVAIRNGADVEQAARRCHLSPRTAARRLTDARQSLGARSTAEAVSLVGRRIDELSGRA